MELIKVYANLDEYLIEAQNKFEAVIKNYAKAREYYAECVVKYETAFAEQIQKLQKEDLPVTTIKEIAKLNCKNEYAEMVKAEATYKKFKAYKEGWQERINTIKFLGRIKYNMFNVGD